MWKLYALGSTIEWARDELDPWLKGSYDGRVVANERIFKCKNTLRAIPKNPCHIEEVTSATAPRRELY